MGGGAEIAGPFVEIPGHDIERLKADKTNIYVWGRVDYSDILANTPRRWSNFCFRLKLLPPLGDGDVTLAFDHYGTYNGADENEPAK